MKIPRELEQQTITGTGLYDTILKSLSRILCGARWLIVSLKETYLNFKTSRQKLWKNSRHFLVAAILTVMLIASAAFTSVFDSSNTPLPRHCTATVSLSSRCDTALLGLIRPTTQLWRWLAESRHLKLLSPMNLAVVDSTASKSTVGRVKTPFEHLAMSGGGVCGEAIGKSHEGAVGQLGHGLAVGQVVGGSVVVGSGGGAGKRSASQR